MKSRLSKYGKVIATKVVTNDASPVDDEKTCLSTLKKAPHPARSRRISSCRTIPKRRAIQRLHEQPLSNSHLKIGY